MGKLLLQAIEWHSQVTRDIGDIWHKGRFLERWSDERILKTLESSFASYQEHAIWQALMQSIQLFSWITEELAEHQRLEFPYKASESIQLAVKRLYKEKL